jgi:hypothetical protein
METQKLSFKDRYNLKIKEYLEAEKVIEAALSKESAVFDLNKKTQLYEGHTSSEVFLPRNSRAFKMKLFLFKLTLERRGL